jgi:hypothetical protein
VKICGKTADYADIASFGSLHRSRRDIRQHQCGAWGANFESGDVIAENCNFYTSKFDFGNKSEI